MRVKLYATLRKAAQRKEVEITLSETTVRGLLKRLVDLYDAEFEGLLTSEGGRTGQRGDILGKRAEHTAPSRA